MIMLVWYVVIVFGASRGKGCLAFDCWAIPPPMWQLARARATHAHRLSTQLCLTCLLSRHKSHTRSRAYSIELMCAAALDVNSVGDRTAHGLLHTAIGAHARNHTKDTSQVEVTLRHQLVCALL